MIAWLGYNFFFFVNPRLESMECMARQKSLLPPAPRHSRTLDLEEKKQQHQEGCNLFYYSCHLLTSRTPASSPPSSSDANMTQWQNSYVIAPCMAGRGRDRTPTDWVHCHGDVYLTSRSACLFYQLRRSTIRQPACV